ncbi:uncharacterized protein LACBIDRAFT_291947 [Laccaria bicolor S238N-H82]|uniref:Predicted protein n=1 Tax=Laccaria bicolor (strain S238N-H82 / ATCC MYA-4686) TaxID=486041 RepID=B0CQN0_LACBS|nr:uncharacterized protein LACBIDRAFT_291947 [Laccaria bicolor S238N-H82]EDR16201.1 predicted protein [Laccaria bicolor S238N-H82]|eukprot:XP_001874409.1 predicted protein [Laccaria bicolor S238N-H82]
MPATDRLIQLKGIAEIFVALILTVNPQLIYDSPATHKLSYLSGLHISNASTAPGFNQSIACMVAAVGVGHLVASRAGRGARSTIFAMNLTWSLLGFLTCAQPVEKDLGSATLLMSSMSHAVFSFVLLYLDGGDMFRSEPETGTRNGNGKRD